MGNQWDELEIYDPELDIVNAEAEKEMNDLLSLAGNKSNTNLPATIIFEVTLNAAYKGVTNCNEARNLENVKRLAEAFAKNKENETGFKLIQFGWRSYQAKIRKGREPFPSNARWCRSYITANCYAVFHKNH